MPRLAPGLVERPRLFAMLDRGARVTVLSAPAGSGKTMLLASWLRCADLPGPVAWIGVERDERDPVRFWHAVLDELRRTGAVPAGHPLATLAPAPLGAADDDFVWQLLDGLRSLPCPVTLVVDDLHHLRSEVALRGVERLVARAPAHLRLVLASRHDPKLGLHRLRLEGELVEIRAADLGFTTAEAGDLIAAAGVAVGAGDVSRLQQRTEGWAAGLRLAAMSLAEHEAPRRFVAEFSGSERTVADYLLAEVLASRPHEVRGLLLRTCILERVCGPLADALTGRDDGARLLHELEEANAFVVALDVGRSWFRYHHLLADLLRLELRREAPGEIAGLHRLAAGWYAEHGHAVPAIRHAELGEDWELATELLGRHWVHLVLDGEEATLDELLSGLPAGLAENDAELASIMAADRLARSRWSEADALLAGAERALADLPAARRERARTALANVQVLRARRLGGLDEVIESAGAALPADDGGGDDPASAEREGFTLMNLGIAETWSLRLGAAEERLRRGLELGRRSDRPYVEAGCLGALGMVASMTDRMQLAEDRLRQAVEVFDRAGWSAHPIAGPIHVTLAHVLMDRGRVEEGKRSLDLGEPIIERAPEPPAAVGLRQARGMAAIWEGRMDDALSAFTAAEERARRLPSTHFLADIARHWALRTRLRLGDPEPARSALAAAGDTAEWCSLAALVHLADGDPAAAAGAVAPVVAGTALAVHPNRIIEGFLLDGAARLRLGDRPGAERSCERALALAEPQGRAWIFVAVPEAAELLASHPMHRTAHAAHLRRLLDLMGGGAPEADAPVELLDPLSERELAVLRFLPTNLSASEIGGELYLSVHTVKTHMRKLYAKLDVHTRAEAVRRGRALGLLAPGSGTG
jgi:LuxR family maltose regulon positive regulatory protein